MKRIYNLLLLLPLLVFSVRARTQNHLEVEGNAKINGVLELQDSLYNICIGGELPEPMRRRSAQGGMQNIFLGLEAGIDNESGRNNIFIGSRTGNDNSSGDDNVFVGHWAGRDNTSGDDNLFFGRFAGFANESANDNIAVGRSALFANDTMSRNIAIGAYALDDFIAGNGFDPLTELNIGTSYNLAIGYSAGRNTNAPGNTVSDGSRNTFIGHLSGYHNTRGNSNTYVGFQSGFTNEERENTMIGSKAGRISTGRGNVYMGFEAGDSASFSGNSVYIGNRAGQRANASRSVFIGYLTGRETRRSDNTFVGSTAGLNNTDGIRNVFLGSSSGTTNTTGFYNTLLGSHTDVESNFLNKATAIGYGAHVACSNCLVLGDSIAKIGIGTTNPRQRLHVMKTSVSGALYNGNAMAIFENNGNGYLQLSTPADRENGILFGNTNSSVAGGIIFNHGTTKNGLQFRTNNNQTRMVIDEEGDVGIGRTNPLHPLHVNGDAVRQDGMSTWGVMSDRRLKKNIKAFTEGLEIVEKINPVYFTYIDGTQQRQIGVIAQEIQKFAPYMVYESEVVDGETYLGYNANALFYILVNAIKEQQAIIEQKDLRITDLEEQQLRIINRLDNLEAARHNDKEVRLPTRK